MVTPTNENEKFPFPSATTRSSDETDTVIGEGHIANQPPPLRRAQHLQVSTSHDTDGIRDFGRPSPSKTREEAHRLEDDLAMLHAERVASVAAEGKQSEGERSTSAHLHRSRSRTAEPVDEFDANTNPLHERTALYKPPTNPTTRISKFLKYIHHSSFIIRWVTYIVPVVLILLIPLLVGALAFPGATVGGVSLVWFSIWLEIVWLTLWAGRIVAKMIPWPLGLVSSIFTNNSKKWRDLGKQLEVPATIFFWWLGVEISFLPTMTNHHLNGDRTTRQWETTANKIIISVFVGAILNFVEKIIIQLIAISFHLRTYADRIELNKFQIGSLTKLYTYSKAKITMEDSDFEQVDASKPASGTRTPGAAYADKAQKVTREAFAKIGDVANTVAGDFTGQKRTMKSSHPHQVVLTLLNSTGGSQVLARRLYRTFVREGFDTVFQSDLKNAFDNNDEADAAFTMFDKDMNGDISMEELEAVCVEIGRERKSITASLKDLDSVVSKLDEVFFFIVIIITLLVLISLISTSAAGVLTSAGSTILALSWLFAATAQEFLQSCIFVFVKHPFDVGDRVSIYGNTGSNMKGDDYFVKEISLLYTEFKKMEGHVVQAPNSYLNTLFILNMRRSGGLAEALPIVIRFGTSLEQIDALRQSLLEFVRAEKREYQGNILTELRDVTEAHSLTLNVVFFYKSNWQNELLRLQRRNKFICALMVAMQELGIEGPRRNLPGAHSNVPYFVQYPAGAPPGYVAASSDTAAVVGSESAPGSTSGENRSPVIVPQAANPSILRVRGETISTTRSRSDSLSAIAKRVDFSLGMKDISSGDVMSDLYDGTTQNRQRVTETMRNANREEAERRIIEEEEEAEADVKDARPAGRSTSRDGPPSQHFFRRIDSNSRGMMRSATDQAGRESMSSVASHRNRFLDRFGRNHSRSIDLPREALMEQGQSVMNERSGTTIGPQAVINDLPVSRLHGPGRTPVDGI